MDLAEEYLYDSCRINRSEEVKSILDKYPNIDLSYSEGQYFIFAIEDNNFKTLELLIHYYEEHVAAQYEPGSEGYKLARHKLKEILEDALEDIEEEKLSDATKTVLSDYITFHESLIKALKTDTKNKVDYVIDHAIEHDYIEQILLERTPQSGEIPLMLAIKKHYSDITIKLLDLMIQNELSLNMRNNAGHTVLDYVRDKLAKDISLVKFEEARNTLLEHGAVSGIENQEGENQLNYKLPKIGLLKIQDDLEQDTSNAQKAQDHERMEDYFTNLNLDDTQKISNADLAEQKCELMGDAPDIYYQT